MNDLIAILKADLELEANATTVTPQNLRGIALSSRLSDDFAAQLIAHANWLETARNHHRALSEFALAVAESIPKESAFIAEQLDAYRYIRAALAELKKALSKEAYE